MSESVAVVIVTFNRADLLVGMLDGLAAQTHRPDAVIVIDNCSTDHTRAVLDAAHRPSAPRHHHREQPRRRRRIPHRDAGGLRGRLGPDLADGRRRGARPRLPRGADGDRRGLPDRRARRHRGPSGGEGRDPLRPHQPVGDPAQDGERRLDVRHPGRPAGAGGDRERRLRGLHGAPRRGGRGSASPTRRSSSSTTTSTSRSAPAGRASASGRCATRGSCASSTSTSSTTCLVGRASTCSATCSSSTSGTATTCSCG